MEEGDKTRRRIMRANVRVFSLLTAIVLLTGISWVTEIGGTTNTLLSAAKPVMS